MLKFQFQMDVVCESCQTEYEFDDAQVGEAGVTVKCTNCNYLFRVARQKAEATTAPAPSTPSPGTTWMLRTAGGDIYRIGELTTLQQWIVERKVTRQDELSRDGRSWKPLAEMAELASFFEGVERAVSLESEQQVRPQAPTGWEMRPVDRPSMSSGPRRRTTSSHAADSWPGSGDELSLVVPRRGVPRWLLLAIGGAVGAFVVVFAAVRLLPRLLADGPSREYAAARAALLRDVDEALIEAERGFKALEDGGERGLALAGLSAVRATRAQAWQDDARAAERHGKREIAAELRRQAQPLAEEAKELAARALAADAQGADANRAMADALRLLGASPAEVEARLLATRTVSPEDPLALYVEGALRMDQGKNVLARALLEEAARRFEAASRQPLLRAEYRLALVEMGDGNREAARGHLERVLAADAEHDRARTLMEEVASAAEAPKAPVAAPPPVPVAEPPEPAVVTPAPPEPTEPPTPAPAAQAREPSAPPTKTAASYLKLVREGDRLSESGRSALAVKSYRLALASRPDGVEALTGLGYFFMDSEKYGAAIMQFRQALSSDAAYGDALIGIAEAYKMQSDFAQALGYYRRYLSSNPSGPKAGMAKQNIRDLESKAPKEPEAAPPEPTTPAADEAPSAP